MSIAQNKLVHLVTDLGLVSETFISETAMILNEMDIDYQMIYQVNHNEPAHYDFKKTQVDFAILSNWFHKLKYRIQDPTGRLEILIKNAAEKLSFELARIKPDILYVDYGRNAVLALNAVKILNIPLIIHLHGADITSQLREAPYQKKLYEALEYATRVIVASHHIKRLSILAGCDPNKIEVIRLPIRTEYQLASKTDYPSLIFLGRLTHKKHPVALLHMFKLVISEIPEARLTIIGDGELKAEVMRTMDALNLKSSVSYLGAMKNTDALEQMSKHWIYVQHSVTGPNGDQEGFGISLAEAAVLELPVVSTIHNGIPEQVIHGETGFLVSEFDFEEMAEYVIKLIYDKKLRSRFGQAGRVNINELCNPEIRRNKLQEIISII